MLQYIYIYILQEALTTLCTKTTPLIAEKICSVIDHAYDMGVISKNMLKCNVLLSSLDFPHLI